ncbi:putative outer membrane salicin receptor [Novosphingobium sp. Rr 2-17]|nr:putative outer membrane salicin receptor [Novosphingobium sp. Rr 2-17]
MKGITNLDVRVWSMTTVAAVCFATPTIVQAAVAMDIPAQSLNSALEIFGQQAGVAIIFDRAALAGKSSHAIKGAYPPDVALRHLVEGSGATIQQPKAGTFVVTMPRNQPQQRGASRAIATQAHLMPASDTQAAPAAQVVQDQAPVLEEIVVTAEKRSENVQNTAASISVRNGRDLLSQGKYSLQSILEDIPGVSGGGAEGTLTSNGGGTDTAGAGITIRGIGTSMGVGGSNVSTPAATALYVDGVYEGVGSDYDIDRIEVLRGPQGTLYGRSATAGVVAVSTRNPGLDTISGNLSIEAGDYHLQRYSGALDVPLVTDVLGIRISGNRYERQGYYDGAGGARTNTDGRIKVLFRPSADFSLLVGAALHDNTICGRPPPCKAVTVI